MKKVSSVSKLLGIFIAFVLAFGLVAYPSRVALAAPLGQLIWLRANANNLYVSADQNLANVQLIANRTTSGGTGSWEQFTVVDAGGGLIALRASNGLYVSADTNIAAYAPLVANRPTFSTWEKFTWTDVGAGQVTLKASTNGKFVAADLNRGANLVADRTTAGGWETFTWGVAGTVPTPTRTSTACGQDGHGRAVLCQPRRLYLCPGGRSRFPERGLRHDQRHQRLL